MFIVYLILLLWLAYACWFSYTLTQEQVGDERYWYNPIVFFIGGVFAAVMIVTEFIEECMAHAARALNKRALRRRDEKRAANQKSD